MATAKLTKQDKIKAVDETRAEAQRLSVKLNDARASAAANPGHFAGGKLADVDLDALQHRYDVAIAAYEQAMADAGVGITDDGDDA